MPVRFKQAQLHDLGLPATLETAFRSYGAFAGVHQFDFDDTYAIGDSGWTTDIGESIITVPCVAVWFIEGDSRVSAWYANNDLNALCAYIAGDSPVWGIREGMWDAGNDLVWSDEQAVWL